MTPRTRTSNRDADFKVYYSKKVAQQVHFPHKSKTVRRRSTPVRDGQEKRQMVFLPDKMRRQRMDVISDSEDSGDLGTDVDEETEEEATGKSRQKGRKRSSGIMHEEQDSENDDSISRVSKRHRKTISPQNHRRTRRVQATSDNEKDGANNAVTERTLRRQSTMTQLVDGRKPLQGVDEPDFKPIKKTPRLSWNGKGKGEKKSRDERQRTLTQMVPGMRQQDIVSDDDINEGLGDVEAEDKDSHAYGDAVARRLAQQGLYQTEGNDNEELAAAEAEEETKPFPIKKEEGSSMLDSQSITEPVLQSVEDDSYKPTQFIEAPSRRSDRAMRRNATAQASKAGEASSLPREAKRSAKARFSLLSTPEKRRIREIPSSQSPADSPLSTQATPHKLNQSPLKQCMANSSNTVADTPSKRKQMTFKMPSKTPIPPPKLRRFESTIQDSEDEDDDIIEEEVPLARPAKHGVNRSTGVATPGKSIGADTQAMLDQIDCACAEASGNGHAVWTESSPEPDNLSVFRRNGESSPELGDLHKQLHSQRERAAPKEHRVYYEESTRIKQEPESDDEYAEDSAGLPSMSLRSPREGRPARGDMTVITAAELHSQTEQLHSTPPVLESGVQETFPSTPMFIQDDSSDDENALRKDSAPSHSSSRSSPQSAPTDMPQSADLDGEIVQVPRSPSPQHETQQSHSSKAEQQLQDEWLSYSQYVTAGPPESSSVCAVPDAFSYSDTPRPAQNPPPPQQQPHLLSNYHPSQATTIDETTQRTPHTKRTQNLSSTHTTPRHRIASSQPVFTSPNKLPPPLFIPSSFPSPVKVRAAAEDWNSSSPVMDLTTQDVNCGSSQWASLEDFSIPLPPPMPTQRVADGEEEEEG
jgi:hypothetical protein